MRIITTVKEMNKIARELKKEKTIGLVPTMGALHEGHLSLIRASKKENDITVCSIFVNPTQFGPNEDLDKYPRVFESDTTLLEKEGCDYLFYPTAEEMYPDKTIAWVNVEKLPDHLCGLNRPGHFRGVTTVVSMLFNIALPDKAYFGQKDYQQSVIIRGMVKSLHFPVNIRVMPIVREKDGLALSSRNKYLSTKQRTEALALNKALSLGETLIKKGGVSAENIIKQIQDFILSEAPFAKIDYVSVVHPDTLEEVTDFKEGAVIALAVKIGNTRLIDNIIIS